MSDMYVRVEAGVVVEGPMPLPRSWKNVSGLNNLPGDTLRNLGWLPAEVQYPETLDAAQEVLTAPEFLVTRTKVMVSYGKRDLNADELAQRDEADRQFVVKTARLDGPDLIDCVAYLLQKDRTLKPKAVQDWLDRYQKAGG